MSCEGEIRSAIRSAGRRYTAQRGRVLTVLRHAGGHRTAEQVFDAVQDADPHSGVALSTIYRTLASLEEMRLVASMKAASGETVFEAVADEDRHHHLICTSCGVTVETDLASLERLEHEIRRQTGFEPSIRHLGIPGLCAQCAASKAEAS
jgi:Fur family ferric uptake transcriptional regulator